MDKNKELVETLITGSNSAKRLQNLLLQKVDNDGSVSVDNLLMEVIGSFSGGLNSFHTGGEFSRVPVSPHEGLTCYVDQVPEFYSGEAEKSPEPGVKHKRVGSYTRKSVKISATIEDGYSWISYGQKMILNYKFLRYYYRCSYKKDFGCKALKQVQRMEDGSNMFHITYFEQHTCSPNLLNTFSHLGVVLNPKESKIHHKLPNNPLTITNVHIDPSPEQDIELSPLVCKEQGRLVDFEGPVQNIKMGPQI